MVTGDPSLELQNASTNGGGKELKNAGSDLPQKSQTTTTYGGAGYGAGGYGANASLDHVREYPSGGMKPIGDGTYGHPTDMQMEQAANLSALTGKNAQTAKDKYDRAMNMYDQSDKSIRAIADNQIDQAKRKAAQNWQAQQQKQLSALNMIANQSGTGQSGSYWNNVMQAYGLVDDMADVVALQTKKDAMHQAYIDEAEALQQNQNARNEIGIDTASSLDALLTDYVAQMSSLYPGFVSGVYGSELNKTWDEDTPEDERPSFFAYRTQDDIDKGLDAGAEGSSKLSSLAESNGEAANYNFAPLVDRENHTVYAPSWWTNFTPTLYEAITPRQVGMIRGAEESSETRKLGHTGQSYEGSSASKEKNLAPYLVGYQNRSQK